MTLTATIRPALAAGATVVAAAWLLAMPLSVGPPKKILPAAASTRFSNPRFLSSAASHDVASNIRQALALEHGAKQYSQV